MPTNTTTKLVITKPSTPDNIIMIIGESAQSIKFIEQTNSGSAWAKKIP